ncbi:MAG: GNAT family N-acetyltransferase [Usitatibacteraceae bacterium]
MTIPVYSLTVRHLDLLIHHFDMLDDASTYLRFGNNLSREARRAYVEKIPFERDALFGVFADDLTLLGVAHLACVDGAAELGVSVLPSQQNRGIGSALFRNLQLGQLQMNCLTQNGAMMHIARAAGMRIVVDRADADAYLELPPGTPFTVGQEFLEQEVARLDWTLKANVDYLRRAIKGPAARHYGLPRKALGHFKSSARNAA